MRFAPALALSCLPILAFADDKKDAKLVLSEEEKGVLDRTNSERKADGLPALVPNERLFKAARNHSANMARQSKLDHTLDDQNLGDRLKTVGYAWSAAGENIAWNEKDPAEVMRWWMGSKEHRANILSKEYTEIGIAVSANARGERYWTQVFAKPLR